MSRKIKVVIQTVPLIIIFEVDGEMICLFQFLKLFHLKSDRKRS